MKTISKIQTFYYSIATTILLKFFTIQSHAQGTPLDSDLRPSTLPTQSISTNPQEAIYQTVGNLINFIILISGSLSVFFIIYAGFQYVSSLGQDDGIGRAKNNIKWIIIGLITMFFSMVIVRFIISAILALEEVNR